MPAASLENLHPMRRIATAVCFLALTFFAIDGQILPSVAKEIETTSFVRGLLLGCTFLFFPAASFGAGLLADRIGKRRVVMVGITLMGLGFGICALGHHIRLWFLGLCIFSAGGGATEGQGTALIGDLNPKRERQIINLSQVFFSFGAVISPALLGLVKARLPGMSLTTRFWWVAVYHLPIIAGLLFMRDADRHVPPRSDDTYKVHDLFRDAWLLRMMGAVFLYVFVEGSTVHWLAIYARDVFRVSLAEAPIFISVFWAAIGVSRLLVSFIPDRVTSRQILIVSVLTMMAGRIALVTASTAGMGYAATALMGLGMGGVWPTLIAVVSRHYSARSGGAVGLMIAAGGVGIPLGDLFMGTLVQLGGGEAPAIASRTPGIRWAMLSLIVFTVVNTVIILTTRLGDDKAPESCEA